MLIVAGLFESAFACCLGKVKETQGGAAAGWSVGFLVCLAVSMALLVKATKPLPIGTAYAVWTGIGAVGTVVLGILFPFIVLNTDVSRLVGGSHYANLLKLSFNLGYSNMAFGAMVGIAGLGVLGFLLYYFTEGKKVGFGLSDTGLLPEGCESSSFKGRDTARYILKTLFLAVLVIATG